MQAANAIASSVSAGEKSAVWQKYVDWLFVPNDFIGLTRRLTGIEALCVLMIVWVWSHGGPGPANVPAWRIGPHLLTLPMPAEDITRTVFCIGVVAALAMIVGFAHKLWPLILALIIGYFGSVDWVACGLHFIVLEWLMLVAFLFERPGRSPTRRLIQISIVACYFFTATQKVLFPDFVAGYSLETIFGDGWSLGSAWRGVLPVEKFGHSFWVFLSWMTIAVEYFFALGLCFPKTRRAALLIAVLFHFGISIFLDKFITIFSLVMWAGLSTFIDKDRSKSAASESLTKEGLARDAVAEPKLSAWSKFSTHFCEGWQRIDTAISTIARSLKLGAFVKKRTPNASLYSKPVPLTPGIRTQSLLASILIGMMALIPIRVFFYPGRPLDKLSFFDRSPWSYCMYLARQETARLDVAYQDEQGAWHPHPIDKKKDRWGRISCDNETYALANYVFKVHPDAKRVKIENEIVLNGHLPQEKVLERDRADHDKEIEVHFLPPYPEIRLQKREDNKGSADL